MERELRIVYMGTPEFAVAPLEAILSHGYRVVAVVTAPDKPAGRGRILRQSAVGEFAASHQIPLLKPANLKDPGFISELAGLNANLQVVVAFRMLPEAVWRMPEYGTFNLHASLLPQYRGAAPINWAIINGETETGVTTFMLSHEIDTGQIMFREKCPILPEDDVEALHNRLMQTGSQLVLKTLESVRRNDYHLLRQEELIDAEASLKTAPKLFKEDCLIRWDQPVKNIHNRIRGLSPVPAAYTCLHSPEGEAFSLKLFRSQICSSDLPGEPGSIDTDGRSYLSVKGADGCLSILELQLEGKKRLPVVEFLRGFRLESSWKMS